MNRQTTAKTNYAEQFFQLTRRHLTVFFKNKVRIFFTLMVPFIILIVYIMFLRDLELSSVKNILADLAESGGDEIAALADDPIFMKYVRTLVDSWMLSGILAITSITVSLQTNTMIVIDRESGVNRDFISSPINRNILIGSYFFFNIIVTVIICILFLLVCLIYLACLNEFFITFLDFLQIVGILMYSSVVSVLLTVFICSFVSRDSTMASISTIVSTAIGFLIGAYMPFAMLPAFIQNICVFVPGTFSCSLLRYSFMLTPLDGLTAYLGEVVQSAQGAELIASLTGSFGYNINFFGMSVSPGMQAVAQLIIIAILVVANVLVGNNLVKVIGSIGKKTTQKLKKIKASFGTKKTDGEAPTVAAQTDTANTGSDEPPQNADTD